jgi:hypothetical protein
VRVYVFKKKKISRVPGAYSRKNVIGFNLLTSALEASLRMKKRN